MMGASSEDASDDEPARLRRDEQRQDALIERFVQQHLPKLGDDRTLSRIPVVVIQAPPVPEERRFYQAILSQVFAPFRPSSSIEDLQHETLRMLVTINVKMLIIDEIHHVLAGLFC